MQPSLHNLPPFPHTQPSLHPPQVKLPVRKVKAAQGGTATQGGGVDTEADDTEEALLKGLRGDEIDLEDAESVGPSALVLFRSDLLLLFLFWFCVLELFDCE